MIGLTASEVDRVKSVGASREGRSLKGHDNTQINNCLVYKMSRNGEKCPITVFLQIYYLFNQQSKLELGESTERILID